MNVPTATKTQLITFLVAQGDTRSPRKLRDLRVLDLRAAATTAQEQAKLAAITAASATRAVARMVDGVDTNRFYTTAEVSELTGVGLAGVRRWVRLGYLTAQTRPEVKRKGQAAIDGAELAAFIARRATASSAA